MSDDELTEAIKQHREELAKARAELFKSQRELYAAAIAAFIIGGLLVMTAVLFKEQGRCQEKTVPKMSFGTLTPKTMIPNHAGHGQDTSTRTTLVGISPFRGLVVLRTTLSTN